MPVKFHPPLAGEVKKLMFGTETLVFDATEPFVISNVGLLGLYTGHLMSAIISYCLHCKFIFIHCTSEVSCCLFTVLNHTVHYSRDCSDLDAD